MDMGASILKSNLQVALVRSRYIHVAGDRAEEEHRTVMED